MDYTNHLRMTFYYIQSHPKTDCISSNCGRFHHFLLYMTKGDINHPHLDYFHTIVKSSIIGLFEALTNYLLLE